MPEKKGQIHHKVLGASRLGNRDRFSSMLLLAPSVLDRPMHRRRCRVDQYGAFCTHSVAPGALSPTGYFNLETIVLLRSSKQI